MRRFQSYVCLLAAGAGLGFGAGCSSLQPSAPAAATQPATTSSADAAADAEAWKTISRILGKQGVLHEGVNTFTFPRDDLFISVEGMDIPTAAGIESVFNFFRCSCGKTRVIGQFVVADYESNDLVFALQQKNLLVSSVGPMLLYEKPRLMAVRFQAEGTAEELATGLNEALQWIGKARHAPAPLKPQ